MLGLSKCCRWTAGLASRMGASGLLRQVAVAAKERYGVNLEPILQSSELGI